MEKLTFDSDSEQQTRRLGVAIGEVVPSGFVIGLNGTLGSGKTRLTQAIGKGLGLPDGQVVSPTFTLATPHRGRLLLIHLDAYRIKSDEEVDELGLDEQIENGAFLVVEWAKRIASCLPPMDVVCEIEIVSDEARSFRFAAMSRRGDEFLQELGAKLSATGEIAGQ